MVKEHQHEGTTHMGDDGIKALKDLSELSF